MMWTYVATDSLSIRVFIRVGGIVVAELKVDAAQLETVATFQIAPQACVPPSAVFFFLVDVKFRDLSKLIE